MLSVNPHAVNVLPDTTKTQKQNPNFEVQFLKLHAQYTEKVSWFFFHCHLYSDSILPKTTSQLLSLPPLCFADLFSLSEIFLLLYYDQIGA